MTTLPPPPDGRSPRVLLLLHELTPTGAPRLALSVFGALGRGIDLRVVTETGGKLDREFSKRWPLSILTSQPPGVRRDRSYNARRSAAIARATVAAAAARVALAVWRPEIVYVNSVHALPLVNRLGVGHLPIILHVHELSVALASWEATHPGLIQGLPDRYIAVSAAVMEELVGPYQIDRNKIAIVGPFVDIPTGWAGSQPARPTREGPVVVGGVGNPSWYKGHDLWLLAARETAVALGHQAVRFRWVGVRDNDEGRHFRAMVSKLGLDSIVELIPETDDPGPYIREFNLLALSSWEESASLAALEVMSHGVPVICFAGSGGPPDLIGDTGIVLPTISPGAMAEAIVDLVQNADRRIALGAVARERVANLNSRAMIAPRIAAEIEGMRIATRPPRPK